MSVYLTRYYKSLITSNPYLKDKTMTDRIKISGFGYKKVPLSYTERSKYALTELYFEDDQYKVEVRVKGLQTLAKINIDHEGTTVPWVSTDNEARDLIIKFTVLTGNSELYGHFVLGAIDPLGVSVKLHWLQTPQGFLLVEDSYNNLVKLSLTDGRRLQPSTVVSLLQ